MERPWEDYPEQVDRRYVRAWSARPEGKAPLDVYWADEPTDGPLLVFHHIRKTAGTALRQLISTNLRACELEIIAARESAEWFADFWENVRDRQRIVCIAGHSANLVLPNVRDRATRPFTIIRDPVDRTISRYHHGGRKAWSLDDIFVERRETPSARMFFLNGQARDLVAPDFDLDRFPESPDDPDCDVWRSRVRETSDRYILGTQDRLLDSIRLLARALGWRRIYQPTGRVNRERPRLTSIDPSLRDLIAQHNWLDAELYAWASKRLTAALATQQER